MAEAVTDRGPIKSDGPEKKTKRGLEYFLRDVVKKFNEEVKKRIFNPYKREPKAVIKAWSKRPRRRHVEF